MDQMTTPRSATAATRRDRRPTVTRDIVVTAREQLSPRMLRLTLGGDDLVATVHDTPGAWIKLFIDEPDGFGEHGRAYTVRSFDPMRDEITIDVFRHGAGTVARWAHESRIGTRARIGGPRASGAPTSAATALDALRRRDRAPGDRRDPRTRALGPHHRGHHRAWRRQGPPRHRAPARRGDHLAHPRQRRTPRHPAARRRRARRRSPEPPACGLPGEAASAHWFRHRLQALDIAQLHVQGYWRSGVGDYRE